MFEFYKIPFELMLFRLLFTYLAESNISCAYVCDVFWYTVNWLQPMLLMQVCVVWAALKLNGIHNPIGSAENMAKSIHTKCFLHKSIITNALFFWLTVYQSKLTFAAANTATCSIFVFRCFRLHIFPCSLLMARTAKEKLSNQSVLAIFRCVHEILCFLNTHLTCLP